MNCFKSSFMRIHIVRLRLSLFELMTLCLLGLLLLSVTNYKTYLTNGVENDVSASLPNLYWALCDLDL